jgi:mannosyl-glycoprotein endo-beta-N-acetylglucosaminidase
MATSAQQQAFVTTYGPYANQAGSRLGIPGNLVLAQWAQESGWGTSGRAAAMGNMAGINYPGSTTGTNYQSYGSPQAFTDSYVNTMSNPRYSSALQAGASGDASGFARQLGQAGYYTGDQSVYANNVSSNVGTINALGGTGTLTTSGASAPPDTSSGLSAGGGYTSGTGYDPETGTYTSSLSPTFYEGLDTSGNPVGATTSPTQSPVSGAQTYQPYYTADPGSYVYGGGGTASTTTPGAVSPTSPAASSVPGDPGYIPPASTGGLFEFGLGSGVINSINGWVSGIETAVGNSVSRVFGNILGGLENWFSRGFLIVLGILIAIIALWRIIDPSGEKAQAFARSAVVAA